MKRRGHIVSRIEGDELFRLCASARTINFKPHDSDETIQAVSVADRDSRRPEIAAILNDKERM